MKQTTPPPSDVDVAARIRALVAELGGVAPAARRLGISRPTINALAAGAPVRVATLAFARERIRTLLP